MFRAHRQWHVSPTTVTAAGRSIPRADIVAIDVELLEARDTGGAKLLAIAYMLATAAILIGVFEFGFSQRYLLAAGLCGMIGLSGLQDAWQATTARTYEVSIRLASGETARVTLADELEARGLMAAISAPA
ncbi:MAG TPA: DUF6232 family protein [Hyphomicrobiaceae bacterium]|nr:DUF6232 family protein [Hyphomicrobiaceae bacterium]